ncbi:MAG TPA: VOC family protein [Solirubrobacteraceae bacterium]|nr:VOC family protein [Solirubrobacteraceae bacterium]
MSTAYPRDGGSGVALHHVQVAAPAGCEEEARRFYGGLLGLSEIEKPPALQERGGVWFALTGGPQLHIGVADSFVAAVKAHPGFRLAGTVELQALAVRLAEAGFAVRWDDELDGVRRFFVDDPFRNRVEVLAHEGS